MSDTPLILLTLIALKAGAKIMDIYEAGFSVDSKSDASPVTEADGAAEEIILAELAKLSPDIPVVAEEAVSKGDIPDTDAVFYLVDPLDGTREFISRNGEFTVNIALIENGVPVAGVVYAPALGEMFWGGRDKGAFRAPVTNGVIGTQEAISVREAPAALTAIGSRSHGSAETEDWLKQYTVGDFIAAGSSLKFCRVAEGAADLYPRHGRTMEWDTAAGDAVLRAAGGLVTTLDGQPLSYGKRGRTDETDFANPYFVAYGDRKLSTSRKV
ncbi:3'(2'),5'-bisphosphate nucleotidase CysQ [Asticcacaulis sp. AND118]|uniref:3'(2'),5'-bisphosphate nucleotidase CysQ n=1 Tax=Asticcacaulis sp. AND118 TaxID=2840468 RepID=UPI001CFFE126|nr:3'(2'),5'-bisphosphate nucleotidase CysQ [Asticcacaulis sp. AND118]UDF03405.1 3'(2'),5'-bisphosphate nucleotidase CysQ [Asticcacaulis sp. AND118]